MKFFRNFFLLCLLFAPVVARADLADTLGLTQFGDQTNLPKAGTEEDTKRRIAGVVNALLGFLGILFTLLIIYGGFKWMLSRGNSSQVDEAKEIIKNSSIGLAIVLLSYVIARTIMTVIEGDQSDPNFIGPPSP